MTKIDEVINKFPKDVQTVIRDIWDSLPASDRNSLLKSFTDLPTDKALLHKLFQLARITTGKKHSVVIIGPANVGKSTLYNQLIHSKEDRADVGPLPGTTQVNQEADAGLFVIIDTPGTDSVGNEGANEREFALSAAAASDVVILMFDAIQGIKQTELELFNTIRALDKPYLIAVNKMDLVKQHQNAVITHTAANLQVDPDQIIPISAKDPKTLTQLLLAIVTIEPQLTVALGQALPVFRRSLAWRTTVNSASLAAAIALTPLPVLDFGPLVVTQSLMVLAIARIYNYKIDLKRARELIAAFGVGILGRTLFAELSKLGGIPGWLLSAAIASSVTAAMGYAVTVWFEKGEKVSNESFNKISKGITNYLLGTLKNLGKKKPSKKSLQESVAESLLELKIEEVSPPNDGVESPDENS